MPPESRHFALPPESPPIDRRVAAIAGMAGLLGLLAGVIAWALSALIACITGLAFYGDVTLSHTTPWSHQLGAWVIVVPAIGGLIVGAMARWGSKAIRGHGIPEAMDQVLSNESRIPVRMTFLKPLSAAIAIGTGGPFGAEGPIIATGAALGSALGQFTRVTPDERKTLLAAGAAAGMAATFGAPVSAVLLAIELLLFEYRARSIVPVALAASVATGVRIAIVGSAPVFAMPHVDAPGGSALAVYIAIGAIAGVCSVGVTRTVYAVEDLFEKLPIHWAWWPAIGGLFVGLVGWLAPRTLGVGYDNIADVLSGELLGEALFLLCVAKLGSWLVALGSGTSGGTLAPLFTIGGALGALLASAAGALFPTIGIHPGIGALVGMAAMFAGASRALLTSVVFAFETTQQPMGLLPLLGGCAAAHFASLVLMRNSIMTEKLARRGVRVPNELAADHLDRVLVGDRATRAVVTLDGSWTIEHARTWLASRLPGTGHQGWPVVDRTGELLGILVRRDLLDERLACSSLLTEHLSRAPIVVHPDHTLREAADHMVRADIGRLVVVTREHPRRPAGILTRSDLLRAHGARIAAATEPQGARTLRGPSRPSA